MAAANQQFSLKWNNYSHHIVSALEELRLDDELTDVTLSCDGQRIKAHKVLLSACSVFFKETFKENPCKHPIVILKGVSFQDLQAVVQFMYNGQVNVTQERLPSFLQTAEILQIKGLTDNASEKEETSAPAKKRSQTFPSQASTTTLDSIRQDSDSRPPTPKRKRVIGSTSGTFASSSAQNSDAPGTSVISSSGNGTGGGNNNNPLPPPLIAHNNEIENSGDGMPLVKFEDQDGEEEYDRNEENSNSFHDEKDVQGGETSSLGSHIRTTSASGAGERRPRYMQPSSNDLSATGVVDATNAPIRINGSTRDLRHEVGYIYQNGTGPATNGHITSNNSKLRNRLSSRSLSSSGGGGGSGGIVQQQDDRVIKYAPLQNHRVNNGHHHPHHHDSRSNSSHEEGSGESQYRLEDGSESPIPSDEDEEYALTPLQQHQQLIQQRRAYLSSAMNNVQNQKGRPLPKLIKGNGILSQSNAQYQQPASQRNLPNGNGNNDETVEDLSVSSPAHQGHDISTPSFSLTQQLLQQNVLCLISNNPATEVIKSIGNGSGTSRVSAITANNSSSSSSTTGTSGCMTGNSGEHPTVIAPYVCDVCGKRYVHHRSLNDHKKSHTGATRCPVCNKSFSKVANMRAHYAAQHGLGMSSQSLDVKGKAENSNDSHISTSSNNSQQRMSLQQDA